MTGYSKIKVPTYDLGGFLPLAQAGVGMIPGVGTALSAGLGLVGGIINGNKQKKEQEKIEKEQAAQMVKLQEQTSLANLAGYETLGNRGVQYFRKGGPIVKEYEVEKDEVVQGNAQLEAGSQIASDMHLVGGSTHENGGTDGAGGERVFSDSIRIDKGLAEILKSQGHAVKPSSTYAGAAEIIGKRKGKMEKKLTSGFTPSINTAKRTLGHIDESLELLFNLQEASKPVREEPVGEFALGGVLKGGLDFLKKNEGQVLNALSYAGNLGTINKLDTNVTRNYLSNPAYNYTDRSGLAKTENFNTFNNVVNSLTSSSAGVNASNVGALYGETLNQNNQITNAENVRKDTYDNQYGQRVDRNRMINTQIANEANDSRRDMYNEKNVALPLQARNAFMQGYAGNRAIEYQKKLDKAKMAISLFKNNENGVMDRLDPKMIESWMQSPIFKMLND